MTVITEKSPLARPGLSQIAATLAAPFVIDLRTLALFRVALGLCLLGEWYSRLDTLTVFHTDAGVLPRLAVLQFWDNAIVNSLFMISGSYTGTLILLLIEGAIFSCYLAGYRTRLMGVLALVFLISAQMRNFAIVQGSDDLLRLLLFWALFLPTNRHFAVDAALDDGARVPPSNRYLSVATVAILLQASYVYVVGALIKSSSPIWFPDGLAVYYAQNIDQFATIWSPYLLQMPQVMKALTYFVFLIELLGPVVMLQPLLTGWCRAAMLPALLAMHVGFALFLTVGLFPLVSATSLLLFLPSSFWDWLQRRIAGRQRIAALYYDQNCTFCYKTCLLLRSLLVLGPVEIRPAQPVPEIGALLERHNSWVVVDRDGRRHLKWAALVHVFRASPAFFWLAPLLQARPALGDRLYEAIGARRMQLGRLTAVLLPLRPNPIRRSPALEAIVVALTLFVLAWNIGTLPGRENLMPDWARRFAVMTRLEQKWDMFAPHPLILDGYYVMRGTLTDGRPVDVLRHKVGEVPFDKPADVAGMYEDQKWRKYLVNLTGEQFAPLRFWYASWLCRQWNSGDALAPKLAVMDIWFVVEPTPPPGGEFTYERRPIWQHRCI